MKSLGEFSLHKKFKDGRNSTCKKCKNEQASVSYLVFKENPEWIAKKRASEKKYREIHARRNKYGVTNEEYLKQYNIQNGKCYICNLFYKVLSQDHCHKTDRNRKLLCLSCNVGLGHFKDNPELLIKAKEYLELHMEV